MRTLRNKKRGLKNNLSGTGETRLFFGWAIMMLHSEGHFVVSFNRIGETKDAALNLRETHQNLFFLLFFSFLSLHSKTTKQTMHVVIKSNDPQVWTCSFLIMPLFKITGRRSPRVRGNRKYPKTL